MCFLQEVIAKQQIINNVIFFVEHQFFVSLLYVVEWEYLLAAKSSKWVTTNITHVSWGTHLAHTLLTHSLLYVYIHSRCYVVVIFSTTAAALTNWLNDHYMTPCVYVYGFYLSRLLDSVFLPQKHLSMWDNNILRFYEFIVFKLKFPCPSLSPLLFTAAAGGAYIYIQDMQASKNLKLKTWWPKKCCCHNIKGHNNIIHEHKRSGAKVSCHILCNTYEKKVKREREIVDWKRSQNCDNRWENMRSIVAKEKLFFIIIILILFSPFFHSQDLRYSTDDTLFLHTKYVLIICHSFFSLPMTFPSPQFVCGIKIYIFILWWALDEKICLVVKCVIHISKNLLLT